MHRLTLQSIGFALAAGGDSDIEKIAISLGVRQ